MATWRHIMPRTAIHHSLWVTPGRGLRQARLRAASTLSLRRASSVWGGGGCEAAFVHGRKDALKCRRRLTELKASHTSTLLFREVLNMPTYEYACKSCAHEWEFEQSIKDDPLKVCPNCHQETARRQISRGTGFILKGGGWYSDLYSSTSNKPHGSSGGSSDGGSSDGSSSSGSSSSSSSSSSSGSTGSTASSTSSTPSTSTTPA